MRCFPAVAGSLLLAGCSSTPTTGSGPDAGAGGRCAEVASTAAYPTDGFTDRAADALAVLDRLKAFLDPMRAAEADAAVRPTASELRALFDAGSPSLRSLTLESHRSRVDGWIDAFAAAAGNAYVPSDPPTGSGGIFGKYIFAADGTDLRQAIEKSMFAATLYRTAVERSAGELTAARVDGFVGLYGAPATFPADDKATPVPDRYAAVYAKRRDARKPDAPGPYLRFQQAVTRARALAESGADCSTQATTELTAAREQWELALMQTVIFYLNDALTKLSGATQTEETQSAALHSYGEAVGFLIGFDGLPAGSARATPALIRDVLALIGAPLDGSSEAYKVVVASADFIPKLVEAQTRIATHYGFTAEQVQSFHVNY
jgi:hypothetical protein